MDRRSESNIEQALDRANQRRFAGWHPSRYAGRSRALVLCGEYPEGEVSGYLVFRAPQWVQLRWWMDQAEFRLAPPAGHGTAACSAGDNGAPRSYTVLIRTPGHELRIVCEGVGYYEPPATERGW